MTTTEDLELDTTEVEEEEIPFVPSQANMGFTTKKFVLQALLEKAAAVLPTRDIMPVLKNFQILVADGKITVIATDLELSVMAEGEMVSVRTAGEAVFPGKDLISIVREAADGDLVLDVVDGDCTIRVGKATWFLKLMDGTDYPALPDLAEVEFHDVDRAKFLAALNTVRYAAASDITRPSLMMVSIKEGKMRAADGVRFQQIDLGRTFPLDIDIPIAAVGDLVKLLKTTDGNVIQIGEEEASIFFRVGGDTFIANKLSTEFPDIETALLKPALGNTDLFSCDRQELLAAIRRVRITADKTSSAISISLGKGGTITLRAEDKFGNRSEESLDGSWRGETRDLAVNHNYITQMLEGTDNKSIQMLLGVDSKARKSPILVKDDDSGSIAVITQMVLDWMS